VRPRHIHADQGVFLHFLVGLLHLGLHWRRLAAEHAQHGNNEFRFLERLLLRLQQFRTVLYFETLILPPPRAIEIHDGTGVKGKPGRVSDSMACLAAVPALSVVNINHAAPFCRHGCPASAIPSAIRIVAIAISIALQMIAFVAT
jgi:hypothetical protein